MIAVRGKDNKVLKVVRIEKGTDRDEFVASLLATTEGAESTTWAEYLLWNPALALVTARTYHRKQLEADNKQHKAILVSAVRKVMGLPAERVTNAQIYTVINGCLKKAQAGGRVNQNSPFVLNGSHRWFAECIETYFLKSTDQLEPTQ